MNRGIWVDVIAILSLAALGAMRVLEGRDVATAILVVVVGRLRPPGDGGLPSGGARATMVSSSGLLTILAVLTAPIRRFA